MDIESNLSFYNLSAIIGFITLAKEVFPWAN